MAVGRFKTTDCVLGSVEFVGPSRTWEGFERDVIATFQQHDWNRHQTIMAADPLKPFDLTFEHERGVRGRFQHRISQHKGNIGHGQSISLRSCFMTLQLIQF